MKKMFIAIVLGILLISNVAYANECPCEKTITVKLYQSRLSLDLWQHMKDSMNAITFKLPVSCKFYDSVKIGDQLLDKRFRGGSFFISGSIGNWNLQVVKK